MSENQIFEAKCNFAIQSSIELIVQGTSGDSVIFHVITIAGIT